MAGIGGVQGDGLDADDDVVVSELGYAHGLHARVALLPVDDGTDGSHCIFSWLGRRN